jgi:iron complex outermembrane receptor protein
VLDRALTIDVSAYYIDWRSIQLSVYSPTANISYTVNGGKAKSEGLELQIEAHPIQTLTILASGSLNDARLKQDLPVNGNSYGLAGDRLPYSAPFTGSLSAEQEIFNINGITGLLGATVNYVGGRELEFAYNASDPRFALPAYTTGSLHCGVRYDSWFGNLFVNNVGNTLGMTSGGYAHDLGNTKGYYASVIAPRTFGLSISKSF